MVNGVNERDGRTSSQPAVCILRPESATKHALGVRPTSISRSAPVRCCCDAGSADTHRHRGIDLHCTPCHGWPESEIQDHES